jgi:hypothetical protein
MRCFDYRMTHSVVAGDRAFPFGLSTAATRNPQYDRENRNSQDAVGICIRPGFMAGVVCDGCGSGSTHPEIEPYSVSSNEVGAKLACSLVLRDVQNAFVRKSTFSPQELVGRFSRSVLRAFELTVKAFCDRDEVDAETFIDDFLMTTVLGFVVTREQFVVFHSGDGVIAVNGQFDVLDREEGCYLSRDLRHRCCQGRCPEPGMTNSLKVYASGASLNLQSIMIATDGMVPMVKQCPKEMSDFVQKLPPREQCRDGFDFALQEFRHGIAWNPEVVVDLSDDATFALVRRLSPNLETEC